MGVPNFKSRYLATHLNKMLEWGVEFIAFVLQYCLQIQCAAFQKAVVLGWFTQHYWQFNWPSVQVWWTVKVPVPIVSGPFPVG